jgi:hypothetical protein
MGCHDLGDGTPDHPICAPAIWTGGAVDRWLKAMPPLWQYFSRLLRQTSPSRPPKGADPGTLGHFACKAAPFEGAAMGAMIATVDPGKPYAVVVGEGHAPVVAVLRRVRDSRRWRPPKASVPGSLGYFSCKTALSEGAAMGAARPIMDPSRWASPRRLESGVEGRGHAPVVAVLLRCERGRRVHPCPQRARIVAPLTVTPANRAFLGCRNGVP